MNEVMELNEINENSERRDALRDPEPSTVQRRIGKPVKLSSILASIKCKIKYLPKGK